LREDGHLRYGFFLGVASCVNLAIVAVGLARYPLIFAQERAPWVVFDLVILVAYAAAGFVAARLITHAATPAIRLATWLGVAAGLLMSADITREYFVDAGQAIGFGVGLAAFLTTLIIFAIAAGRASDGSLRRGAAAGAWSAIVCMTLVLAYAWLLNYLFMDYLAGILVRDPEYLRGNTLVDPPSYTVWNTLSALASHGALLPLLGAVLGTGGAWMNAARKRRDNNPAWRMVQTPGLE